MAKIFAERAIDNAVAHAYDASPDDSETLPYLAERKTKSGGAIMVFARSALVSHFGTDRLSSVAQPAGWGNDEEKDEAEERLARSTDDDDFMPDMLRHITRIILIDPAGYKRFKHFVLRYRPEYAPAFAQIESLVR